MNHQVASGCLESVEWNDGMVEWTTGMEYWNGLGQDLCACM